MSEISVAIGSTDFEFYAKFTKSLILTLNRTEDRILASAWFSKLRDEASGSEKLRLDYLKLLLFVLQRHSLAGPFTQNPNIREELDDFGENYNLADVAKEIIEKEQEQKKERYLKRIRGETGDFSPFSTDYSPDLREYVAAQDIPNFGVHVYYAISKDPILDWDNAHHAVFPKMVRRMEPQGRLSETSFAIIEPRPETPEISEKCKILEETGVMPDESIFLTRKSRPRKSPFEDVVRPAAPLGLLPGEGEGDLLTEELPPPTWGSNLIEVQEPLDIEGPETPPPEPETREKTTRPSSEVMEGSPKPEEMDEEEIAKLLETSFNMEDIMAEVDAIETEDDVPIEEAAVEVEEVEDKFKEIEADLDRHDAALAEVLADLDEDERRMLMEMEAEEGAEEIPKVPTPSPKKEVKIVADDDTVIKVLVETPEAIVESVEEKKRKQEKSEADKKKKPVGRTGLNKGKAKGALLKPGEKKAIEEEEKKAKVVTTKTGVPAKGGVKPPAGAKAASSKTKVDSTASAGKIPPSKAGIKEAPATKKGIPPPGSTGIQRPGGIPRPAGTGIPRPGGTGIPRPGGTGIPQPGGRAIPKPADTAANIKSMKDKVTKMLSDTKAAHADRFEQKEEEVTRRPEMPTHAGAARTKKLSPIQEMPMGPISPGSPESDDIYDEMEKEYKILERLYELYQQLAPDQPEELRTPPIFSKHPQIKQLGRQLRYRPDEFDINPMESFTPGTEFFARPEQAEQGYYYDERQLDRMARIRDMPDDPIGMTSPPRRVPEVIVSEAPPSGAPPEEQPLQDSSPPWSGVDELKRIAERAEKRVETSPAITSGVSVTTPKSPSTPKRLVRKNLLEEFDMESPPLHGSPEIFSPPPVGTPEFVRIKSYGFPEVLTEKHLEQLYAEKYPEYEAYLRAEIEDEKQKWIRSVAAPPPQPAGSAIKRTGMVPEVYQTPDQPSSRYPLPRTPPSVGSKPGTPGTPKGVPPEYRFDFQTPPRLRPEPLSEIPDQPEIAPFIEEEDLIFQLPPELVDGELGEEEFAEESPDIQLQHWLEDPLQTIADAAPYEMGLEIPQEMISPDLVPEDDDFDWGTTSPPPSPILSPLDTLQQRLTEHQIPPEFLKVWRPAQKSKRVYIKSRKVPIPRTSMPTPLAKEAIEEDLSGEEFEETERLLEEEEEKFMEWVVADEDRVDHLKKMIEQAELQGDIELEEEELPEDFIEFDEEGLELEADGEPLPLPSPFRSPIRTPERPIKPVVTPPAAPSRGQLLWQGSPEKHFEGDLFAEEAEFLASPGLPTPEPRQPSPPPREMVSPGAEPGYEDFIWDTSSEMIDIDEEDVLLASPELPPGRTLEEDFREIGSPVKLGPPSWEQPVPPPPAPPVPQRLIGSPEIEGAALQRELRGHAVRFPKATHGGFKAGRKWVGRRSARNYALVTIGEHLDYEESKKMPGERETRPIRSKLPPAPPPPTSYPSEMMGEQYPVQFYYPETLMDQPFYEDLPPPLEPDWEVPGWRTPPHLKMRPIQEIIRTPPRELGSYAGVSHYRDPLLFEEAPEGVFLPEEEDIIPLELMGEELFSPPQRHIQMPSQPRPVPYVTVSPRAASPSAQAIPMPQRWSPVPQRELMQPVQQMPSTPPPPLRWSPQMPSPPAPHWSPQKPAPPPAPHWSPLMPSPPPAPHWSPQPGPSWAPHQYPYAPPSPVPQPPQISPLQRRMPPSPDRLKVPSPPLPPCAQMPEPGPKVTKRSKEISFSSEVFDPHSPDESRKWTRGKTILEFNRPEEGQRPVISPPPHGVAVYARGPPASGMPFSPQGMEEMPPTSPPRRPQRRSRRPRGPGPSGTPSKEGRGLPRRMLFEDKGPRKRLLREFTDEEPEPVIPLSRVRVCPGSRRGETVQVVEDFEEMEQDYIPEHLRGFKWMDEPDESPGEFW